eukprot:scaffold130818_cov32-Tisochrysis_lutea.AAC.3
MSKSEVVRERSFSESSNSVHHFAERTHPLPPPGGQARAAGACCQEGAGRQWLRPGDARHRGSGRPQAASALGSPGMNARCCLPQGDGAAADRLYA